MGRDCFVAPLSRLLLHFDDGDKRATPPPALRNKDEPSLLQRLGASVLVLGVDLECVGGNLREQDGGPLPHAPQVLEGEPDPEGLEPQPGGGIDPRYLDGTGTQELARRGAGALGRTEGTLPRRSPK